VLVRRGRAHEYSGYASLRLRLFPVVKTIALPETGEHVVDEERREEAPKEKMDTAEETGTEFHGMSIWPCGRTIPGTSPEHVAVFIFCPANFGAEKESSTRSLGDAARRRSWIVKIAALL